MGVGFNAELPLHTTHSPSIFVASAIATLCRLPAIKGIESRKAFVVVVTSQVSRITIEMKWRGLLRWSEHICDCTPNCNPLSVSVTHWHKLAISLFSSPKMYPGTNVETANIVSSITSNG